ncbi:hypothetical protein [Microbulbifer sp. TYP-18]|uniref:hypothetical protein n=1 Tax=Microbulbifer sp. TYP-18 TaxID=3230024 RepID=UPI0034C69ED7
MEQLVLKTDIENAEFYLASLAIGILDSMRTGEISLEVGIWSLARPTFWEPLEKSLKVSCKLVDWISSMDELDALQELNGDANRVIQETIELLKLCQQDALNSKPALVMSSKIEKSS